MTRKGSNPPPTTAKPAPPPNPPPAKPDALAAENAELREQLRKIHAQAEDATEYVLSMICRDLKLENAALRKDAERYHRVMQVIRSLCAAKTPDLLADLDAAMGEKP